MRPRGALNNCNTHHLLVWQPVCYVEQPCCLCACQPGHAAAQLGDDHQLYSGYYNCPAEASGAAAAHRPDTPASWRRIPSKGRARPLQGLSTASSSAVQHASPDLLCSLVLQPDRPKCCNPWPCAANPDPVTPPGCIPQRFECDRDEGIGLSAVSHAWAAHTAPCRRTMPWAARHGGIVHGTAKCSVPDRPGSPVLHWARGCCGWRLCFSACQQYSACVWAAMVLAMPGWQLRPQPLQRCDC